MKKQQVLVSVTGWTKDDEDQPESVRLLTTGTFSGAREDWRIDYTETQPDNDSHAVTLTMGTLQNTIVIARWAVRSVENVTTENDSEPQI